MFSACCIFLSAIVFTAVSSQRNVPENTCPNVFQYINVDNYIYGKIQVPYDGRNNHLSLNVNASILGVYNTGKLQLKIVTPTEKILGSRYIDYEIQFPFQDKLPKITQIMFNGVVYCQGQPYELLPGRIVASLWANSNYYVNIFQNTNNNFQIDQIGEKPIIVNIENVPIINIKPTTTKKPHLPSFIASNPFFTNEIPTSTSRPTPPIIQQRPKPTNDQKIECGLENKPPIYNHLIVNGEETTENQFPWVVAMMVTSMTTGYQYKCTANLISDRHVITAARCVNYFKVQVVNTEDILLIIGRSDISRWATSNAERRTAKKVTVHPDYTQNSATGDLCVIEFFPPIKFSDTIKSICLWDISTNNVQDQSLNTNNNGKICGWGQSSLNGEPVTSYKAIDMPITSQENCRKSAEGFKDITSDTTFCAGKRNGDGPCIGDQGAGFMVKNSQEKWHLKGMVSIWLNKDNKCKLDDYIVFSDVSKYSKWIKDVMNS